MLLLVDVNVDARVGAYFTSRGHQVAYVRDLLGSASIDEAIAFTSVRHGLIVVTHDRDFRRFSRPLPAGSRRRVRTGGGRILLLVPESEAVSRIAELIDVIEFFHERCQERGSRTLVEITPTGCMLRDREPVA
jgi:hypothetical protein